MKAKNFIREAEEMARLKKGHNINDDAVFLAAVITGNRLNE